MRDERGRVAIVDYELGNLFSVQHACEHVGLATSVTAEARAIASADAVILPGVGAFGDAMDTLRRLDLVGVLTDMARSGRPFLGICLGMQLLMNGSTEFGGHTGLGIVPGTVEGLAGVVNRTPRPKIPHIGWNQMRRTSDRAWTGSLLEGIADGVYMHFVHSFYVRPDDVSHAIATTDYAGFRFCSALQWSNVFACQAHPERSGPAGLAVYENLASVLEVTRQHA